MRGKASPATRDFESPYAVTILPAKDAGRASKRAAARVAEVAPQEPLAEAPAYVPTHGHAAAPVAAPGPEPLHAPPPAPVDDTPAPAYAPPPPAVAAPAPNYPAGYPSVPGFPPQPHYANAAQVADHTPFVAAPPAASAAPSAPAASPAPVGYPSASYQPLSQPAAYQPAAYAPPTNPPSGYQPNRFEPQGYAAPGYQAPGYAPPGYAPPGQAQPYQNFPPTGGRSAGAKALIGLAIGIGGFVILGILAAIAIPVFVSQRDKTANRNVVLPSVLLEQPRLVQADTDGSVASEIASLQRSSPGMTQTQAAFYGSAGQPIFLVVAGKLARQPTSADYKTFFSIHPSEGDLTLAPAGSGPYGGKMECGQETSGGQPVTACESLDSAAAVVVVAPNMTPNQLAVLARQIIDTIEQKG